MPDTRYEADLDALRMDGGATRMRDRHSRLASLKAHIEWMESMYSFTEDAQQPFDELRKEIERL